MNTVPSFRPGQPWLDTAGHPIQAHGGGILYHENHYYWYGENKDTPTLPTGACGAWGRVVGMSAYRSRDLVNWEPLGLVLPAVTDDPAHDLHPAKIAERPKVLFNARTGKFVMWLHVDHQDYGYARAAVAIADRPEGPFRYLGSVRPEGQESRDLTVFQDDDGSAYLVHSSEGNRTLRIVPLSEDYLSIAGPSTRHFVERSMEAPAIFKRAGRYYLVASGCTCWHPNAARSAVADSLLGPWTELGNPCVGPHADLTFRGQGTFVLPVAGHPDAFIFMADQWNMKDLGASRYVWLPVAFEADGSFSIHWSDTWNLSALPL
jgi:beta-xylosidase